MNTQVEDIRKETEKILKERSSQSEKREKLLKIGLTNSDIQQLFFAERLAKKMAKKEREAARNVVGDTIESILSRYTFGVEIECCNVHPSELINSAMRRGLNMHQEGYNHIDNDTYYKLVSDSSIRGNNPIECVSPILNGGHVGFDSLKACCESLNEIGANVNKSTGLHIHVGGTITNEQYVNTFINYACLQRIVDKFMSPSRRGGMWAKSYDGHYGQLVTAQTPQDVLNILNHDRYYSVNPCSWSRHRTIEFRQHAGTTDYKKISMWAKFCIKLVHFSETHRYQQYISSVDEIEFLDDNEKAYFKSRIEVLSQLSV